MKINKNQLNVEKFNSLTQMKWANEQLEAFKCNNCGLIVLGIPDCHVAFFEPSNLNKTIPYNLPRKIYCPNCKAIWYDYPKDEKYKTEDITLEELLSSDWNKIFSKK